ncbi:MAG: hypothetical protein N2560_00105 [Ignavibacteria bacterium]|nr:hypothetical protein [Ignavibacteria bacterium]
MELNEITEKIIEYLDGELPHSEEAELFAALSTNEELRTLMREHLAISRTIYSDATSLQPPPTAALNIVNALGLSVLNNEINNTQSVSSQPFQKARKFGVPILIALLSSLLTFFVTYYFFKPNESDVQNSKSIVQTPPIIISTIAQDDKPNTNLSTPLNNTLQTKNNLDKRETLLSEQKDINDEFQKIEESNINRKNDVNLSSEKNLATNLESRKISFKEPTYFTFKNEQNKNIYFTFRGIAGKSFPNPGISIEERNNILSNASLGLFFTQWDNIKFGIEFGNEIFGLSYLNTINGIEYIYEQKPAIYWGAVGIDYVLPFEILNQPNLQPFITLLAGGSQIGGPLIKGIGGLKYRPNRSNFEIYLGAEGTLLFYQNQKNYYLTRKIGITYGISIIF